MNDAPTVSRVRKADSAGYTSYPRPVGLPQHVITRAAHRVGTAALTWAAAYVAAILVNEYAAHTVGHLPPHGWNLGHTVAVLFVTMSFALFGVSRSGWLGPERLLDLGLVYEVVGGFAIVVGTSAGMIWDERAHILGLSWICVWIAGFPFIIPATPSRAGLAAFLTAAMAPIGLAAWHLLSGTSMPSARIWSGFTVPPLLCAGIAMLGARIVYGMGRDIERARQMGAYRLEERLGEGGMGEIWLARHRMLARPAAVKLVRLDAFRTDTARSAALVRFEREAQLTARLSSPHTVRLYDFGVTETGVFYYAMELLDGLDLESLVRLEGPMRPERAVHFLIQACRSLAEAHALGLVHRDIKPANLFVCRQGEEYDVLKVLDFGLVRPEAARPDAPRLTDEATIVGTPAYMAPEAATGEPVGPPADLYALGCVGYWLLTGEHAFGGRTPVEVLLRQMNDAPVPVRSRSASEIPAALEAVLLKCLEKDPRQRPPSAEALDDILAGIPLARRWTRASARESWKEFASASGAVTPRPPGEPEVLVE
jgi:serine/threonine-protein kinase